MYSYAEERHPTLYMRCTLAPPGEYYWIVRLRRRCGLMSNYFDHLFMATLCNRAGHIYFHPVVCSIFLLFSSPNLSRRRLDVYHTSTHGVALVQS